MNLGLQENLSGIQLQFKPIFTDLFPKKEEYFSTTTYFIL